VTVSGQARSSPAERAEAHIPPLRRILGRLADRLDALARTAKGAELVLRVRVVRGKFHEARRDPDERIGWGPWRRESGCP
jgi:hypothetical protein